MAAAAGKGDGRDTPPAKAPPPPARGVVPAQRPLVTVLYLLLATSTQMLLALYGLLSRFVQASTRPGDEGLAGGHCLRPPGTWCRCLPRLPLL